MKIELTDSEWMSLIDGDREGGLERCCANVSALRDVLISVARNGGNVLSFDLQEIRLKVGWVVDSHDVDIPALTKVCDQLGIDMKQEHESDSRPEI